MPYELLKDWRTFRNGQAFPVVTIPFLPAEKFLGEILQACEQGLRPVYFWATPEREAFAIYCVLADDETASLFTARMKVSAGGSWPSLTLQIPSFHIFEREIHENTGLTPEGHPWLKPVRYHVNYRGGPDLWDEIAKRTIPGVYPFYAVDGEEVHEVGVGPVHAGIIEPGHFRFQCHGEEVMHLEIQLGYQHRGIEPMMCGRDLNRSVLLSESVAGDTSIGHSLAFCEAVESLAGCAVPLKAQAIRAIALELERLTNHVGDLGALGMDAGFLRPARILAACGVII